ncbi:MAG TPA: L,D-transpeptidase family protein [Acidimicrobiales bacterium]
MRVVLVLALVLVVNATHAAETASAEEGAIESNSVTAYGAAVDRGPAEGMRLKAPLVDGDHTPSGDGYWLVAADGGVFTFGDARFHGSTGSIALNQPIVAMAATTTGDGYWLAAADGGVFTFGDASFHGGMGGKAVPAPVVGVAASPDGHGYWLAGMDGQVYEFGVADHGSAAVEDGTTAPATVAITPHPGDGYLLVHAELATLEVRDTGRHVRRLQEMLRDRRYWVGSVDGIYGDLTTQAVYAFEKVNGLPVDGTADPEMRRRLASSSPPRPISASGEHAEIDKHRQVLFVVGGDGTVDWAFNTSTGTEEPYTYEGETYLADTPPGDWEIYREVDGARESNLGRLYRPKYFHTDGIAVHGYSFVPPYPASHGCVRVTNAAMDYLWANNLLPIGMDVLVHGETPR